MRRSLLERKKEKEEEEANRIKEKEMQVKALFSQRSNLAQLCGDDLPALLFGGGLVRHTG